MAGTRWTDDQRKVIEVRDKNVLVAAAAGSGKTAVLVEHIISLVTGECGGEQIDIDKLLVVTFTNAAASEMRERILKALEQKMKENPTSDHLRKQLTYIHNAKIATIDSFCKDVVKEHFNEIDIDPAFKIADSGDLALLQSDVLSELLEKNYVEGTKEFHHLIDVYSDSRSDKAIEDKIMTLYRFSQSYPNPEKWLDSLVKAYEMDEEDVSNLENNYDEKNVAGNATKNQTNNETNVDSANNTENVCNVARSYNSCKWFRMAMKTINMQVEDLVSKAKKAMEEACDSGLDKLPDFLSEEYECLSRLTTITGDFDALSKAVKGFTFGRFPTLRGLSEEDTLIKDSIKSMRDEYKAALDKLKKKYFIRPLSEVLNDVKLCAPVVRELVRIVKEFSMLYRQAKLDKDMTDFSDIEHYALEILAKEDEEGNYLPTLTALEMAEDYYEIMIDEYQDSNLVQEIILTAISGRGTGTSNVFMVGDVKQSIYKFRLARPELFLEKYDTYPLGEAGNKRDCEKIVLSKNFRSRHQVLDFCNDVFRQIMVKELGGISYDEENMLYPGMDFPNESDDYKAEIMFVDMDEEGQTTDKDKDKDKDKDTAASSDDSEDVPEKIELEAAMTVAKIKELMYGNGEKEPLMVFDKETKELRPLRFGDIAILFRSTKAYADTYTEVFMAEGIPVYTALTEGYFDTFEISAILDMLSVIDNPRQDIKLAAVLRNVFGLSENMLADIKLGKEGSFYEAFESYEGIYASRVLYIKEKLLEYRQYASYKTIYDLICIIVEDTYFREFLMAGKAGEKRMANVEMLLQKAKNFEEGAYNGLFNFVRYIELMKKYKVEQGEANVSGENDDSVKLMTIHKSKGLEYPVVFVAGMGKRMNMADVTKDLIIHHELGIGINRIDTDKRVKYKTLIKETIAHKIKLENLAEELRVLYVALTRAREKLILTGVGRVTKKLDEYENLAVRDKIELDAMTIEKATSYMDWIMMCISHNYGSRHVTFNRVCPTGILYKKMERTSLKDSLKKTLINWDYKKVYDGDIRKWLEDVFSAEYIYKEECGIRQKMSISDIKHMFMKMTADAVDTDEFPAQEIWFGELGETDKTQKNYFGEKDKTQENHLGKPEGNGISQENHFGKPEGNGISQENHLGKPEGNGISQENHFIKQGEVGPSKGALRGTAYHRVFELFDYDNMPENEEDMKEMMEKMASKGLIDKESIELVDAKKMLAFSKTDLAKRMEKAHKSDLLFREKPFVMGIPACEIDEEKYNSKELVVVQGIVDAWFIEDDGVIVVDYKTDSVEHIEDLEARYRSQLVYYGEAIKKITGREIKELVIYSVKFGEELVI